MKKFRPPHESVLPIPVAAADRAGRLQVQHFVRGTLSPLSLKMIQTAQQLAAGIKPPPEDDEPVPAAFPWKDSSGEGAASALESLKKLEERRNRGKPQEDERPAAD